ncbi:hypothetical protein V8C40DRAFT_239087 [Trichoderma camerunense]
MDYIEPNPPPENNSWDERVEAGVGRASVESSLLQVVTPKANSVWLDLTRAIAGRVVDHEADSAAVLEKLISNALDQSQVLEQYLTYLHPSFHPGEDGHVRVARLLIAIVEFLKRDTNVSASSIDGHLLDPDNLVFKNSDDSGDGGCDDSIGRSRREVLIFMALGWITNLFIPKLTDGTLIADTEHATGYQTSHVASDLAYHSVLEVIREFGDILPTRRPSERQPGLEAGAMPGTSGTDFYMFRIASMNISTLQTVGGIKIEWTSSFASHLDFDPARLDENTGEATPILKLFRYPSLCYLFMTESSLLNQLLENWYAEDEKPVRFTTMALMHEIRLSYQLLIRFDRKARATYLGGLRASALGSCFDPKLDALCLWRRQGLFLERFQRDPLQIRETFYSSSDFPIFSARLVKIDRFINSIQPNRISSLWKDKRDMLRWYTFWAVIILGVLSLAIGFVQTAIGAAQVELARQSLKTP